MGNSSQGVVLNGEVQAVKEGTGINIAADGTISVDEGDLTTFVRLNNGAAYNNYVWPNVLGAASTFLMTDAAGNLTWQRVRIPVNTVTPTTPTVGEMWFDCATGQFKVYESCTTGTPQWTSVSQPGLPVLPANTSAAPAFTGGSGTSGAPYTCTPITIAAGSNVFIVNTVTITGLAPNQYVPIVDLNAVTNGGRYSFTNFYADSAGTLTFQTVFKDQPASPAGTTYTANIKVGYGTVYISAQVGIVSVLSISDPGSISGTPEVGQTLTYTIGSATGGTGVYSYTWEWVQSSNDGVLQTGGANYVIPSSLVGDQVYVRLTATDTVPQSASANTDLYPAGSVISKGPFPNPTPPAFPGEIGVDSCFTWDGSNTTLQSDGCIEFNVNGGAFSQAAKAVATNDVVCSRWVDVPASGLCGDAPNGTIINGCVFDATHEACGSLTIDRVPSTFPPFATVTDHVASTVATSSGSTPFGYNATSFVTGSLSAGASTLEGSIDGGLTWAAIPASGETFGINPGETLFVRYTTGASSNTTYVATINLGQSPNFTTQTFTVVNDAVPFPSTTINFPTFIPDVTTTTWNEPGTTALTATGCLEMSTTGAPGSFSQSLSISFGNTLYTRWITSAACGDKASGPITGCIKGGAYEECDTLNVNRVPTNFPPIPAVTGVLPGAYATSAAVTPTGTTAPSYLTTSAVAGVSNVGASIDGGVTWNTVPTSGTTFQVPPNTSVQFRYQGASAATTYTVPFRLGDGVSSITQNFVVTTGKPAFPNTNISFPAYIPQVTTTTWNEPGSTVLTASGCIQISLDGVTWTNATETIANGATLYTRYNPSVACGGAASGPISGCVSSATGEECGTLTINRTPSNFPPIAAVTGVTPGAYGTSAVVSPGGFTAPSYVTVASVPTGVTNIEASTDGGTTWFGVGTATSASAVVNPDQNITFRFKGANPTTTYSVNFRLGDGTNYVQQAFSVTTGTTNIPTADWAPSPSTGPNASPDTVNTATLKGTASGIWNGTVPKTLTATGSLQVNLNGGGWGSSATAAVSGTDVIGIRWDPTAVATAVDGAILTGTVTDGVNVNTYSFTVSKLVTAGSLAFGDLTLQPLTTTVTSAAVTPTGFNVPLSATFAGTASNPLTTPLLGGASGGGFVSSPATVNPGDALQLRGTTGGSITTAYGITINLGGQSDTWTATTVTASPVITPPNILTPTVNATGVGTASGITITADPYATSGGAGSPQTKSTWEVYKGIPQAATTSQITNVSVTPGTPGSWTTMASSPVVGGFGYSLTTYATNGTTTIATAGNNTNLVRTTNGGTTWVSDTVNTFTSVLYAKGKFWGIRTGQIFNSPDGVNWTSVLNTGNTAYKWLAYEPVNNAWVAAGGSTSSGLNSILRSTDDWASYTTVTPGFNIGGVGNQSVGNGIIMALAESSGNSFIVSSSDGGVNWINKGGASAPCYLIIYVGGNSWVIGGGVPTFARISTNNGTSWTSLTLPAGLDYVTSGAIVNGTLFLFGGSTTQAYSTDFTNFTAIPGTPMWAGAYTKGAVGCPAGGDIYYMGTATGGAGEVGYKAAIGSTTLTFADNTGFSDFSAGVGVTQDNGAATGFIQSLNSAGPTMTLIDNLGTWGPANTGRTVTNPYNIVQPPAPPTTGVPDPTKYTAVTGSPFTKTTGTLTSLDIAKPPLEANTKYWVRAQYETSNTTATTSAFGAWRGFTTGSLVGVDNWNLTGSPALSVFTVGRPWYANNIWVTSITNGSGTPSYVSSTNGTAWTSRTSPTTQFWPIILQNGKFFTVTNTGTPVSSTDGLTWSPTSAAPAGGFGIGSPSIYNNISVPLGSNAILFGGNNGSGFFAYQVSLDDGATWSGLNTISFVDWAAVPALGVGPFMATNGSVTVFVCKASASGSTVMVNSNGTATGAGPWTAAGGASTSTAAADALKSVVWTGTNFVAVGANGTWRSATGSAGWTQVNTAVTTLRSIAYGGGVLAASTGTQIYKSSDEGTTWTLAYTLPAGNSGLGQLGFTNGVFACTYNNGSGECVMISL